MRGELVAVPGQKGKLFNSGRECAQSTGDVCNEPEHCGVEIQLEMHGGRWWKGGEGMARHSTWLLRFTRNGTQCIGQQLAPIRDYGRDPPSESQSAMPLGPRQYPGGLV